MEDQALHFCRILLFYFRKKKNAHQACEKLHIIYSHNALQECRSVPTIVHHAGDFDVKDVPWSWKLIVRS